MLKERFIVTSHDHISRYKGNNAFSTTNNNQNQETLIENFDWKVTPLWADQNTDLIYIYFFMWTSHSGKSSFCANNWATCVAIQAKLKALIWVFKSAPRMLKIFSLMINKQIYWDLNLGRLDSKAIAMTNELRSLPWKAKKYFFKFNFNLSKGNRSSVVNVFHLNWNLATKHGHCFTSTNKLLFHSKHRS